MYKNEQLKGLVGDTNLSKVKEVTDIYYRNDFCFLYHFTTVTDKKIRYYQDERCFQVSIDDRSKLFKTFEDAQQAIQQAI